MNFVSAQYVNQEPPNPPVMIRAVDDTGAIWWHRPDCDNGDWLRYLEQGGTIAPAEEPPA